MREPLLSPLMSGSHTDSKPSLGCIDTSTTVLCDVLLGFHPGTMDAAAGEPLGPKNKDSDSHHE